MIALAAVTATAAIDDDHDAVVMDNHPPTTPPIDTTIRSNGIDADAVGTTTPTIAPFSSPFRDSTGSRTSTPIIVTNVNINEKQERHQDHNKIMNTPSVPGTTTPNPASGDPHSTVSDLALLGEMDGNAFEELMKERTRLRKEKEDYSVAELRVKIVHVEQALTAEVKRRVCSIRELEEKCLDMVSMLEQRLSSQLQTATESITFRLTDLEQRITALETSLEDSTERNVTLVTERSDYVKTHVQELMKELQEEKKSRLVREGRLLQQLESHGKELEEKWSREQEERIVGMGNLSSQLELQQAKRVAEEREWQAMVQTELQALKEELVQEVKERQEEDESIVTALHTYTKQLQQSLSILSEE